MAIIEVEGLVKVYEGEVRAVDDVSFEVERGEAFGFLGPNGAGKTTTIRIIVTLLSATAGSVVVDGIDAFTNPEEVRKRVGYAAQFIGVDDDLTASENLILQGRLHGLSTAQAERRAAEMLELASLSDVAGRRAGKFSGGMRRRLDLAQALVHEPSVLFLDEPTTGLDPQNRRALWSYLRELEHAGTTIFLTTQYMEEAEQLATRLAIIDEGKIAVEGSPAALKSRLGGDAITLTLPEDADAGILDTAAAVLSRFDHSEPTVQGTELSVFARDGSARLAQLVRMLDAEGVPVARLEVAEPSLNDVFLQHTGTRLRVEETQMTGRTIMSRRRRRR